MTSLNRRQFNRSLLALPAAALVGTGLGALAPAAASAAPADWDTQLLAAGQLEGTLSHRTRAGDGTWNPSWSEVDDPAPGAVIAVSSAGISKALHVVASINGGAPKHKIRNGAGSWTTFKDIPSLAGPTGDVQVAVTSINNQLHVFAAPYPRSTGDGRLFHTVRYADGTWWTSWKLLRDFGDDLSHIATTKVGTSIATAVVMNGDIFLALRSSTGTWTGWGKVARPVGEIERIEEVALAGTGSNLQVVALTGFNTLYHAFRRPDATWQRFTKMTAFTNYNPLAVSAVNTGGDMQLAFIDRLADDRQIIRHSTRSGGAWQPVKNVSSTGLTDKPGSLTLAATAH